MEAEPKMDPVAHFFRPIGENLDGRDRISDRFWVHASRARLHAVARSGRVEETDAFVYKL